MDINEQQENNTIRFEEPVLSGMTRLQLQEKNPKMIQWVINHSGGYVRTRQQAHMALVIFIGIVVLLSIFFFRASGGTTIEQTPEELINTPQPRQGQIPL